MIGIIVQLLLSWIIAWVMEKKNLSILGLNPSASRLWQLVVFMSLTGLFCATGFLLKMYVADQAWVINPKLSFSLIVEGFWRNLKLVLFEELIFRGALLYILYTRLGERKAIAISATSFGIYHWFSLGVLGNPMGMAIVFIITGLMGILLAYAYVKTSSLYIPIAIHFGWNITQNFVFSNGPIGNGIFVPLNNKDFRTDSWLVYLGVTFLPIAVTLIVDFVLVKKLSTGNFFRKLKILHI